MVMLKKKREVNYRKGTTGRHCAVCDHFVGEEFPGAWPRCTVIGLKRGKMYRIGTKNLCDRFEIEGESW